jgi:hypothetical protein
MNIRRVTCSLLIFGILPSIWSADPPAPKFRAVDVDTKVGIGYGLAVADVDGDKKLDILLVDKDNVAWYQNPTWQKHIIAEKLTEKDHVCIAAADIDGDGKAEVAVGAEWNPGDTENSGAVFYLIPPKDRTQKWEPVKLPHEPTVHRMRWVKDWQERMTLIVAPLHGRGNNPGQGTGAGVKVQRYIPPANPRDPWEIQLIDDSLHKTHNLDPVQWDDDAATELLICGKEGVFLSNWSQDENKLKLTQLGTNDIGGTGEVRLGKLAGGKRFIAAVEPMHGNVLAIYTPGSKEAGALWKRQVLDESLVDGHALGCGDFLGIGRDQIAVGWRAMNKPGVKVGIKLFTPLDAEGKQWRQTLVDDNTMACEDLALADFNGDGKLDIVAAGRATKNLKIYFNESGPSAN